MKRFMLSIVLLGMLGCTLGAGSWNRIETEYTSIIFEGRDEEHAQTVASFADEVFLELASLLDHKPDKKVPVLLAGRPAHSNGFFSPFPASITLYLSSPTDRFLGSRSASWLRSLYTHELTHYLHLTSPIGPAKYLFFLGPEIPAMNTALMPLWWVEGITTYAESEYAKGGRGDSPLFALSWQSPMLEDSLWTLSQGRYNSSYPPSGRIYSTGYLMVDYLTRHYGKESFARVNSTFAWFPFFGLNGALKKETGFSSKELFDLAVEEQRKELPQYPSPGVLFSPDSLGDYYLPEPTGLGLLGFSHTLKRGGALVRYTPDGSVEELKSLPFIDHDSISLTSDGALFSFAWADPYHVSSIPLAPASYSDLMLYHFPSDSFRRITHKEMLFQPLLSEDGTLLIAIRRTGDRHTLVSIEPVTGKTTVLYDNPLGSVFEPALAKDDTVVVVEVVEGNSALIAVDREGRVTTLVPPTRSEIRSPLFADERSLFFVSDDTGFLALYRYDMVTGVITHMLSDPQGVLKARLDGGAILYETYRAEGVALKRADIARLSPVTVTLQEPDAKQQEGQEIIFSSKGFVDYPRLNLVLPFPFVSENSLQPGLWIHSQSLLRRQLLTAQIGWDIANAQVVGNVDYLYRPGPYSLGLNFIFEKERTASVALSFPLLYRPGLYDFKLLSLQSSLTLITSNSNLLYSFSTSLRFQVSGRPNPKDFFGAPFGFTSVGGQIIGLNSVAVSQARIFGSLAGQARLFSSSQMLGMQLDAVTDSSGSLKDALLYEGFKDEGLDGEAKGRLSLYYHIPLGLPDLPIPYGGMTGIGLSLSAQSALYLKGASLLWDEEIVFSARITASVVLGSGLNIKPFVALAYRLGDGAFSLSVGLNGKAVMVTEDTPGL